MDAKIFWPAYATVAVIGYRSHPLPLELGGIAAVILFGFYLQWMMSPSKSMRGSEYKPTARNEFLYRVGKSLAVWRNGR